VTALDVTGAELAGYRWYAPTKGSDELWYDGSNPGCDAPTVPLKPPGAAAPYCRYLRSGGRLRRPVRLSSLKRRGGPYQRHRAPLYIYQRLTVGQPQQHAFQLS
jgi:hypothetical protein